jgi:hypothetical protein
MQVHTDFFVFPPKSPGFPGNRELTVARLVNSFGPMHFSVSSISILRVAHRSRNASGRRRLAEDVMRYPFNWALLSIALVAVIKSNEELWV